jgi:DNA-binding NarL/FixJ family response regulator
MREGLVLLLEREGFEVVAVAGDGEELVRKARAHRPEVVVADIRMPPTQADEGLRAALSIRTQQPQVAIVVLSQHVQRELACELLERAAEGGGVGYLLKQRVADGASFCSDLERIGNGAAVLDPEVVRAMLARPGRDAAIERLTPRQREVLALMAEGRSNAGIAERLVLSERAVVRHVNHIYQQLDLRPDADDHRRVLAVVRYLSR